MHHQAQQKKPKDRTHTIILWLIQNQVRINTIDRGEITFHFAGKNIKPVLKEVHPDIKVNSSD